MEIRFVGVKKEQHRILKACHVDPIYGHMGVKQTLSRISERFMWPGMVKDTVRHAAYDKLSMHVSHDTPNSALYMGSRCVRFNLHC